MISQKNHDRDEQQEITQLLQTLTSGDTGFCIYPGCDNLPVKNHSISKSIVLSHLSHKGKVVAPHRRGKMFINLQRLMSSSFTEIGINQASVFEGLCQHHDDQLWADLDNQSYMDLPSYEIPGTSEWIVRGESDEQDSKFSFLLLYRAVIHASSKSVAILRAYLQRRYAAFGLSEKLYDPWGSEIRTAMSILRYKIRLDDLYQKQQWDATVTRGVRVAPCEKTWAYSQFIFLDDVVNLHPVGASFTLLPGVGECSLRCVSLREESEELENYLGRHWLQPGHPMFRCSLSKLALQDCDNLYIHPRFWRNLGDERRQKIQQFWIDTGLWGATPYYLDEDLNLFDPPKGGMVADG